MSPGRTGAPALVLLAAGCAAQPAKPAAPSLQVVTPPLATSLVTAQGTWAVAVMGGSAAAENNFWQLFVRPRGASRWSLVTPQGVADNGGLVAAGAGPSLLVGFRPSQGLAFSPLATSTDTGKNWTPGLLDADLADVPDALAEVRPVRRWPCWATAASRPRRTPRRPAPAAGRSWPACARWRRPRPDAAAVWWR